MEDSLAPRRKKRKARPLSDEEWAERGKSIQREKPPSDSSEAKKRKKARKEAIASEDVTKVRMEKQEEKTDSAKDRRKDKKERKKKKHPSAEEAPQKEDTGKEMELVDLVEPKKKGKHLVETGLERGGEERRRKKKKREKKTKTVEEGDIIPISEGRGRHTSEAAGGQSPVSSVPDFGGEAIVLSGDRAEHWKDDDLRTDLKYGAFSREEDEILRAAVAEYIQERNLGEDGIDKLLNTRKHKEIQGAWLEIARCLPERSVKRVHARACRLLHGGNYKGRWSREEEERLQTLHSKLGPKWVHIGSMMGRLPDACKDKWKTIGVTEKTTGQWSPQESELLTRLVRESLAQKRVRTSVERAVDGRQVRDDIDWTAISVRMGVRTANQCLRHWYDVLAPSVVRTGTAVEEWGSEDDQVMLQRIAESGASSEADVEWGSLLSHRDGAACRKRWRMMVKHLPPSQDFERNLTNLCERYAPGLV